jgi:hypothetical protein
LILRNLRIVVCELQHPVTTNSRMSLMSRFAEAAQRRRQKPPRPAPAPAPDPRTATPKNPQISSIERSPMFTKVIDVGMKPKSSIFNHVSATPAEEKAAGGQI